MPRACLVLEAGHTHPVLSGARPPGVSVFSPARDGLGSKAFLGARSHPAGEGRPKGESVVQVQRDSWSHFLNAGSVASSPLVELGLSPRPTSWWIGAKPPDPSPRFLSLLSKGGKGGAGPPGSVGEQGTRGGQVSTPGGPGAVA